ncbi:unnamed protein product [Candidula unifasciata]|uniref:F-BAR domain-containing protein n=1 Tax=Candidula unifasciata TaxID=100452 RepID=A0A8S3Z070_9EUPU|nr:unnamed protein product [Candidula unifasciata]
MTYKTYADVFWGGDLRSVSGYAALTQRNQESKKMCQELEEYLKKRSKVEEDYSKALQNLAKCFKPREEIGVIEATLNKMKVELEILSQCHHGASVFYQHQSEAARKFKEDQAARRKALEESLNKAQSSKIQQLNKTVQAEKVYVRKYCERDAAEQNYKELIQQVTLPKEIEKAKNKKAKAEEDAEKADSAYKSAVKVLDDCRVAWEKEMVTTCKSLQELDQERIQFLRHELWLAANVASKIALDIDNSSESLRELLEKCDIVSDIQAFIETAKTGQQRPEPFVFKHYTKILAAGDTDSNCSDSVIHVYNTAEDDEEPSPTETAPTSSNFNIKAALGRQKILKKKGAAT